MKEIKADLKEMAEVGKDSMKAAKEYLFGVFFYCEICFCSFLYMVGIQNMLIFSLLLLSLRSPFLMLEHIFQTFIPSHPLKVVSEA